MIIGDSEALDDFFSEWEKMKTEGRATKEALKSLRQKYGLEVYDAE